ncbi:MAG: SUMF1/EgtB/PvdO family nonheme iron enzyme [Methylococcaceae bacterium]
MADIFLSYAREDLAKARALAVALEKQGWSVFWDKTSLLAGQDFEEVIEQAIEQAGCMIVAWSMASKKSDWVRGEATLGRERSILVPILFDEVEPPIAFRALHTENFAAWSGDVQGDEFNKLQRAVARLVGSVTEDSEASVVSKPIFIEPEIVRIPADFFLMGSDMDQNEQQPAHLVNIAKPFLITKYLVTFDEYEWFVKAKNLEMPYDHGWGREKRPVIDVSWKDASAYAAWLSEVSGKSYRLPSEAEWEYAARSGTESAYYWGDSENDADNFAWFNSNSEGKTHPVGEKQPNAFGIYDMSGNVWEWVQDCWHDNYDHAPGDGSAWQAANNGDCSRRVLRGGSWNYRPQLLRSANRDGYFPCSRDYSIGFRLARDFNQAESY